MAIDLDVHFAPRAADGLIEYRVGPCTATVILDSVSTAVSPGPRLTTFHLRYPRIIHSEFMTHRAFSRNGRSSRAVPVVTMMEEAYRDPYIPHFLKNKPGMQATEEFDPDTLARIQSRWDRHSKETLEFVRWMQEHEVHKQWANRPLEWFGYIDVLVSSTEWNNWFALRDHGDAQPEIHQLALAMRRALDCSEPNPMNPGNWHMPYIRPEDEDPVKRYLTKDGVLRWNPTDNQVVEVLKKVSTARCARLSYKPFDGNADIASEVERHDRLVASRPVHASPAEHIATPDEKDDYNFDLNGWRWPEKHGNFTGWIQYRKTIPYEYVPG